MDILKQKVRQCLCNSYFQIFMKASAIKYMTFSSERHHVRYLCYLSVHPQCFFSNFIIISLHHVSTLYYLSFLLLFLITQYFQLDMVSAHVLSRPFGSCKYRAEHNLHVERKKDGLFSSPTCWVALYFE